MRILLYIIAILLDITTRIRNLLFDYNILSSKEYKTPIICIGNLAVGGTGKTPLTNYIINIIKEKYTIAVLSRGYGRSKKGFKYVGTRNKANEVGDEPLMLKNKHPNIIVAVDSNKRRGIEHIIKDYPKINVILLDDGFQHRWIKSKMNILLTKYKMPFYDDYLYPFGNLRENKIGFKRSDIVMITKCPNQLDTIDKKRVTQRLRLKQHQKVYFSSIEYEKWLDSTKIYSITLVSGIEDATPLINYLNRKNHKVNHLKYADHHNYTKKDCLNILTAYQKDNNENKMILTTDKDKVKLEEFNAIFGPVNINCISINIKLDMQNEFTKQIIDYVETNKRNIKIS